MFFDTVVGHVQQLPDHLIIRHFLIISIWSKAVWRLYLMLRQLHVYRGASEVPKEFASIISAEKYEEIRSSSILRGFYLIASDFCFSMLWTSAICFEWLPRLWDVAEDISAIHGEEADKSIFVNLVFMFLNDLSLTIMGCPLVCYKASLMTREHDFNENTLNLYLTDHIKLFLGTQCIIMPVGAASIHIINSGGRYFFAWLWMLVSCTVFFLYMVCPSYIDPLFDTYTRLEPGELRTSIEQLAESLHFPLIEIYIDHGTYRSAHSHAYLAGVFEYNKVVLNNQTRRSNDKSGLFSNQELLAMVCHEMGHWKLRHLQILTVLVQLMVFVQVVVFAVTFKHGPLYMAIGFPENRMPIVAGYFATMELVMGPINAIVQFVYNVISRQMEYDADNFTVVHGHKEALNSSLVKLQKNMMFFPVNDSMFSVWYFAHPTILQRLKNIANEDQL